MSALPAVPGLWRSLFSDRFGVAALFGLLAVTASRLPGIEVSGTIGVNTTWRNTAEPYVVDNIRNLEKIK